MRAADGGRADDSGLVTFLVAVLLTQLSIAFHNDWCDRDADALAKPWRWIPRGVLSARAALAAAVLLLASGVLLAASLGPLVAVSSSLARSRFARRASLVVTGDLRVAVSSSLARRACEHPPR